MAGLSPPLVLASASPRRRDLLERAGVRFEVRPSEIPEELQPGETPAGFAARLAREKAGWVAARVGPDPPRLVLGADTIVVIDGDTLGKPVDAADALVLLSRLVGRTHRVLTAVALIESGSGTLREALVESRVSMRGAEAAELREYIATGEPLDKAGAYAAQGEGRRFVASIAGSETNVIGLPMDETLALLRDAGAGSWAQSP